MVRQTGQLNNMIGKYLHSENILPTGSDHTSYQLSVEVQTDKPEAGFDS